MYVYLGDFPTGATIFFPFHTFSSAGASVTISGLAVTDIEVYKGASMTQRSSDAGYALVDTDGIDLDGVTGIHGFTIDTSDNTDSGFYAAGNDYTVVVSSITVDSQTVNFIVGRFSIDNRSLLRPTTAQRTLDVSSTGAAGLDFNNVELPLGAVPSLGIIENGTMQAGSTSSTAVLRAATSIADDLVNGAIIEVTGGTGAGQVRVITDWVSATDTATVSPDWGTTPDNTSTYIVRAAPPAPTASGSIPAVNVTHAAGTAWASGAITAAVFASDAITAAKLASDVTTELQSGLATAAELAKVPKSDGTATWNATALAAIQSEANDALVANHLDHLLAATYDPASKPGAADALLNELVENDAGVSRFTANALEEAPTGGSAPTVSEIADEVQTRTIAAVTTVNGLAANVITAAATAADFTTEIQSGLATAAELAKVPKSDGSATWNATALASLQQEATDALNAYDPPTRAEATSDANSILAKLPSALVGGRIDANVGAVNGSAVDGSGTTLDPWGPA